MVVETFIKDSMKDSVTNMWIVETFGFLESSFLSCLVCLVVFGVLVWCLSSCWMSLVCWSSSLVPFGVLVWCLQVFVVLDPFWCVGACLQVFRHVWCLSVC